MAVDFALQFPCEVRKQIPEAKLVELVGYRALAEFAVAEIRKTDPNVPLETLLEKYQIRVSQTRPDGTTEQVPMTVGQLAALTRPLEPFRAQCGPCRANIADRPFGCIAKINYPIRTESEAWLLSRLPADAGDPGLSKLFQLLVDFGIDGAPVEQVRDRLCESKQTLVRRWMTPAGVQKVTSSQILQMFAFVGDIVPPQAQAYTFVLGLERVLSDPHPPSANIEQFKTFMCAVVMSSRLDAGISVRA